MIKIDYETVARMLKKGTLVKDRSLLKYTSHPTEIYVFSGHPIDSYMGTEDNRILVLRSLSDNSLLRHDTRYTRPNNYVRGELATDLCIIEGEEDVLSAPDKERPPSDAVSKNVFSRFFAKKSQ